MLAALPNWVLQRVLAGGHPVQVALQRVDLACRFQRPVSRRNMWLHIQKQMPTVEHVTQYRPPLPILAADIDIGRGLHGIHTPCRVQRP